MAKRVVNNGIEFAYASENAENELKKELEKYIENYYLRLSTKYLNKVNVKRKN